MSPVRACAAHGAGNCPLCKRRARARSPRRSYSDTAAYRAMVDQVLETYGVSCHYCAGDVVHIVNGELVTLDPNDPLVLAHVIPHAAGGPFELDNLRPAHRTCNLRQGRRHG